MANVGDRPGREVVQVYLSRRESQLARPPRWFAGSAIVHASPGETVSAHITVPRRLFANWSAEDHDWRVEAGFFTVHAARHADASVLTVGVQPN
ncbi:fibronectin type III-like domain-contianing protein [Streptomyces flaveus]|uniref:Fibronectin type III-like domain-containing protein n=1 Tax=Streptomyces flaveus TaxID=66370 RepID=A0A917VG60_9ACTN|nr:fibronectin type III-like domain-contianing protein [Streptomyces flaveus]GGK75568.1 hypothetical protein GCM10010094_40860 [Streptomyces flaveus]